MEKTFEKQTQIMKKKYKMLKNGKTYKKELKITCEISHHEMVKMNLCKQNERIICHITKNHT